MPTVFSFESLSVCVRFFLFFACVDFVGFSFYVVELVKRRTVVRSDQKSDE